jgi:hypothetical protein|nr:MAG TPA: hypothetical protein [Caudoviricetes sp.]
MSNSLSRFSPTATWDSLPEGSLGLALVPSGGAYTVEATSSAGGGNVPKLGESDTNWVEQATTKGTWMYRRYNGLLFIKPKGQYSVVGGLTAGANTVFQIPQPYRDNIETSVGVLINNSTKRTDGSNITIDNLGNVAINAQAAGTYIVPTLAIPYSALG